MSGLSFDGRRNETPVGYYSYTVVDDHWTWSEGMYELHGYEPLSVAATTELMLQHKHPDDALRAFEVLESVTRDGRPFSCYHRIVDAKGQVRSVLSVGRGLLGAHGRVEEVTGYFVDLTVVRESDTVADGEAELVRVAESRSVVERAKGIVMVAHACDGAAAFSALRSCAAERGLRVSELAQRLVEEVAERPLPEAEACREALGELLDRLAR